MRPSIVQLTNGLVRGRQESQIHSFLGIPYAEPLTGPALWLPPKPRRAHAGEFDATRYGAICTQFDPIGKLLPIPRARHRYARALAAASAGVEGDDCLVLNVWSPTLDRNARLPVMVWIHGGGFSSGCANAAYDAAGIAAKGVVVVVIQYRLGPAGFLHGSGLFDGDLCTDNRAFLDQICALQWVQQNIEAFGGETGNVTLFGQSAGAFAIYQLAASPLAKGLFHRGIAMGGTAATCAPADEYHHLTRDALEDVGVKAGDAQALVSLNRPRLRKLQSSVTRRAYGNGSNKYGSLGRERVGFMGAAANTAFLPQTPLQTYPLGTPNKIDLMLGTCADDGRLFSMLLPLGRGISARLFGSRLAGIMPDNDIDAQRRRYRERLPQASAATIHERLNHDAFYRMPTIRAAEAHATGHPGRTFHYQLDYVCAIPSLGAIHAIDVSLLFATPQVDALLRKDIATERLTDRLRELMTSFARSGTPVAAGLPVWQPYDTTNRTTMVLDEECRLHDDLDGNLRRIW